MCKNHLTINLGFIKEKYPAGTHMCFIYSNEKERKEIISKYLEAGNSSGEKVTYFADEMSPEEVKAWLKDKGVNILKRSKEDSFNIVKTADTYHPHGIFNPDDMLDTLKSFHKEAKTKGFPASRVTGEMSWALKGIPGSDRLMEYEAKVNDILDEYPVTAICQYDANKFSGDVLFDCLQVHPYMIVRGQVIKNPYYIKSDAFLKEKGLN